MSKKVLKHIISTERDPDQLKNFETSPLRFEYDLLLEEYKAMRAQIDLLTESQKHILSFSIGLIAALGTIYQLFVSKDNDFSIQETPIAILIICCSFYF